MAGLLLVKYTQIFKALAHPIRLKIVRALSRELLNVNELSQQLKKRQSNISQHLQILRKNNLVSSKSDGKKRIYKLDEKYVDLIIYLRKYSA